MPGPLTRFIFKRRAPGRLQMPVGPRWEARGRAALAGDEHPERRKITGFAAPLLELSVALR
jgi:hypothetical protein